MVPKDQAVSVPRYAFEAMAAYASFDADKVAVMLLLLMRMDFSRAVRIDTSLLPELLTLSSERVGRAVSGLIKKSWVDSIDEDAMRHRFLDCVAHAAFIHADFDTLTRIVNTRLKAVDVH
ncbi:hypothetical protein [Pseudomonas sp. GM25]|uniref:hypothetical protein n=1 Tax=Pseudomonas sp. GM25 TaxID=1144327 RepID=UPI0002704FD0|nr:hypothetical protein [Pseudomonas sp. GM25]EJM25759.1 hypothetical protein PMI24_04107 [Pseudomonas sp. GM25]